MASEADIRGLEEAGIVRAASKMVPLHALKHDYLVHLLQSAEIIDINKNEEVFERGNLSTCHFYLLSGSVRLEYASGHQEVVLSGQQFFALIDEIPRPCRAVAHTDSRLLVLDADVLDTVLSWSQITEYLLSENDSRASGDDELQWLKTVLNSNLFFKVPPMNAESIIDKMTPVHVNAGEVIVREGDVGHCCFIIRQGVARVWRNRKRDGSPEHLADIGAGRCFGEDALVYETVRNASVEMLTSGLLMRLEKADFKLLLVEPPVDEVDERDLLDLPQTPVFVDVRTVEEYMAGHLMLATNVPLSLMGLKRSLLDLEIPYVMYCDTGRRSRAAAYLLGRLGYRTMALKGGLTGSGMQYQLVNDMNYVLRGGMPSRV